MFQPREFAVAVAVLLGAVAAQEAPAQPAPAKELAFRPFDQAAFEQHMLAAGATERQLEEFRKAVPVDSAKHAVDDLLRETHADYRAACKLAEDDDPKGALALAQVVQGNADPYAKAYARYHLGKEFLEADDPEQAATILAEFVDTDLNRTPLDSEVIFFYGSALAMIPDREVAIRFFNAFLREFPDAPERLRSSAAQIKAELEQQEGVLHDISDVMKSCERKIRKTDTGEKVQEKQKTVIAELQKIIEEWEKRESSGGAPGGAGGINPAENSALPGGEATKGVLKKAPPKVAAKWGDLNDGERKAIEAELSDKMSPRYKKMLEKYYERLNKGSK